MAALAGSLALSHITHAQVNTTWIGPAGGTWNVGANWSGGAAPINNVPAGTRYNVFIDGEQPTNSSVVLSPSAISINNLSISAGDQLTMNAPAVLTILGDDVHGALVNQGTITFNTISTLIAIAFNTASTSLSGGGVINMGGDGRISGSGTLLNQDNTIRGAGSIGFNSLNVINNGTLSADLNGGSLTLDPPATNQFFNNGCLRAANGGTMLLANGAFNNLGGGTFQVLGGSTISFGTFATVGGGTATVDGTIANVNGAASLLDTVDGAGTVLVTSGGLYATHLRVGTISVTGGTATVLLSGFDFSASRAGNLVLTGTGRLDLSDNDLIVTTTPRATVESKIVQARNGGLWDQPGLASTSARTQSSHATTLGTLSGAEYFSIYGNGALFDGLSVAPTDTLVKYTWYGDTDFNGRVNFDDYVRTDNGFNNHLSGWFNGDFDLNGVVNFDDYVLIDLAFNTQSGTLRRALSFLNRSDRSSAGMSDPALRQLAEHLSEFGPDYARSFLAAVPEPAGAAAVMSTCAMALARRARRARKSPASLNRAMPRIKS